MTTVILESSAKDGHYPSWTWTRQRSHSLPLGHPESCPKSAPSSTWPKTLCSKRPVLSVAPGGPLPLV
jgi:hypothetical protein